MRYEIAVVIGPNVLTAEYMKYVSLLINSNFGHFIFREINV